MSASVKFDSSVFSLASALLAAFWLIFVSGKRSGVLFVKEFLSFEPSSQATSRTSSVSSIGGIEFDLVFLRCIDRRVLTDAAVVFEG